MASEMKNKGGRPRKEPDPARAEFRFQALKADIEFVDAAAARLGVERGTMIRMAVEAYVDPFARLEEAVKTQDQMRKDMREMRSMFLTVKDMITKVSDFITDLFAAEAAAEEKAAAEAARAYGADEDGR